MSPVFVVHFEKNECEQILLNLLLKYGKYAVIICSMLVDANFNQLLYSCKYSSRKLHEVVCLDILHPVVPVL